MPLQKRERSREGIVRIALGSQAPEIALPNQEGEGVDLATLRGRRVLLSFHPLAWTEVCRLQMQALEARATEFTRLSAVPLGISVDPVPCKKAWAEAIGIEKTRLLSDFWPHGRAAAALGLFREKQGFSERAGVILDEKGIVRFVKVYPLKELPDLDEQIEFLRNM
ncbi:MAG: redoxin domain-containing protein [bacterium]